MTLKIQSAITAAANNHPIATYVAANTITFAAAYVTARVVAVGTAKAIDSILPE